MHMTSVLFLVQFNNFALITGFIGAIQSYSIRPFLWAFVKVLGLACETGHTLQARISRFFIGFGAAFHVSTFFPLDVTRHHHT